MPWGVAAAAVTAAGTAYAADQSASSAKDAQGRSMWNVPNSQDLVSRAKSIADTPYQAYDGQRVADLTGNEKQAYDLSTTGYKPAQDAFTAEKGQVDALANNGFSGANIDKYMNPYVTNVVDRSLDAEKRSFDTRLGDIGAKSATMGAFGGSQQALLESQATKDHLYASGDIAAKGYGDAYDKAVSAWGQDNQRMLSAAQAYSRAGNDITNMTGAQITDLLKTGGANRMIDQMKLDNQYSQFLEKRDWTKTNFQDLKDAVSVANGNKSSYVPDQSGNVATQYAGAAAAIIGAFGKMNSSSAGTPGISYVDTQPNMSDYNSGTMPGMGTMNDVQMPTFDLSSGG